MSVFVVTEVARQVEGEYVFVKVEKVFKTRESAERFMNSKPNNQIVTIQNVPCKVELGILEANLEE